MAPIPYGIGTASRIGKAPFSATGPPQRRASLEMLPEMTAALYEIEGTVRLPAATLTERAPFPIVADVMLLISASPSAVIRSEDAAPETYH
jgi:hypothetical protein